MRRVDRRPRRDPVAALAQPGIRQHLQVFPHLGRMVQPPERTQQAAPLRLGHHRHAQRAAGREVDVVGHVQLVLAAQPPRRTHRRQLHGAVVVLHRKLHVEHRQVDVLAATAALAGHYRGQDAQRARHAGAQIGVRRRRPHRHPVRVAGQAHDAGVGLDVGVERGAVPAGPGQPVAGDRAHDDARVERGERRVVDAQAPGDAGAIVLQHHVGPPHQVGERRLAGGMLEVDHDAALVALVGVKVGRYALFGDQSAGGVAGRRLHLDHVGAQIGQQRGRVGPGQHRRQVDQAQPRQRFHGCEVSARSVPGTAPGEPRPA